MAGRPASVARYAIRRLPFILLALKGVWVALFLKGFSIAPFWYISEIQATSLASNAVLAYYAYKDRHRLYLKICVLALSGLNVLNIIYYFFNYDYLYTYSGVLIAAGLSFALFHAIRKTRKPAH